MPYEDGAVAKQVGKAAGPLVHLESAQRETERLLSALEEKLSPVIVPIPRGDSADAPKAPNQLVSILIRANDLNLRLSQLLESVDL